MNNVNKKFNYNKVTNDALSLCIPRIESGITTEYITAVFTSLDIGIIKNVTLKHATKSNGSKAFINFRSWNKNETADKIKHRLENNEPVNIMYQIPWYWKLKITYLPE